MALSDVTNPFKQALAERRRQVGLWLTLPDAYVTELCATAGFDWLLLDGEHSPADLRAMLAQLQAIAPYRSHPIVRPVEGTPAHIKQLLDIGAQTLLIPMVDNPGQAALAVAATRYPPRGIRGVGAAAARVSRWGQRADYVARAHEEACLLVQAESATALANLEGICAVDGIDGVFIGPSDLAASLGHPGRADHPDVRAAIEDAIVRIVRSGKAAGTLVTDEALARRYLDLGCTFVAVGIDARLLATATRQLAGRFIA